MNRITELRAWYRDAQIRLADAKDKAAEAEQCGRPDKAQRFLEQHGAPAARDLDLLTEIFERMGVSPDDHD